jgi:hypothetical protein
MEAGGGALAGILEQKDEGATNKKRQEKMKEIEMMEKNHDKMIG